MYAKDFDGNGTLDPVITVFLKDQEGKKKEYTAFNRDDILDQMPPLKKNFLPIKNSERRIFMIYFLIRHLKLLCIYRLIILKHLI
jgi:hypothetical protein